MFLSALLFVSRCLAKCCLSSGIAFSAIIFFRASESPRCGWLISGRFPQLVSVCQQWTDFVALTGRAKIQRFQLSFLVLTVGMMWTRRWPIPEKGWQIWIFSLFHRLCLGICFLRQEFVGIRDLPSFCRLLLSTSEKLCSTFHSGAFRYGILSLHIRKCESGVEKQVKLFRLFDGGENQPMRIPDWTESGLTNAWLNHPNSFVKKSNQLCWKWIDMEVTWILLTFGWISPIILFEFLSSTNKCTFKSKQSTAIWHILRYWGMGEKEVNISRYGLRNLAKSNI
jgi:hypothetical protein